VRDPLNREHEVDNIKDVQIVGTRTSAVIRAAEAGRTRQTVSGCLYLAESGHHVTKVILDLDTTK
jgi:hypothetical protein